MFLAIYIDNLFLFGSDKSYLTDIQDQLNSQFKIINLRDISHYLIIKLDVEVGKNISFRQTTYLKKILKRFQIANDKPTSVSMNPGMANFPLPSDQQADRAIIKWYQSIIGSLMWPTIDT